MKSNLIKRVAAVAMGFTLALSAFAPVAVSANSPGVAIDGTPVAFPAGEGPVIVDGRTLVPVRGVFEALGFEVDWDAATSTAIISDDDNELRITIGEAVFTANGAAQPAMDVYAQIINDRTMVPIRLPLEAVGFGVGWDGATSTVLISTDGEAPVAPPAPPTPPAPPAAAGVVWSMADHLAAWQGMGFEGRVDLGNNTADYGPDNPWNAYVWTTGYDSTDIRMVADGIRINKFTDGFDNGLIVGIPAGVSAGDVARFYFTINEASGGGNGVLVRSISTADSSDYSNFAVPEGQPANWPLTAGTSHVTQFEITNACLARGAVHITMRFGQSGDMVVTNVTFGEAPPAAPPPPAEEVAGTWQQAVDAGLLILTDTHTGGSTTEVTGEGLRFINSDGENFNGIGLNIAAIRALNPGQPVVITAFPGVNEFRNQMHWRMEEASGTGAIAGGTGANSVFTIAANHSLRDGENNGLGGDGADSRLVFNWYNIPDGVHNPGFTLVSITVGGTNILNLV